MTEIFGEISMEFHKNNIEKIGQNTIGKMLKFQWNFDELLMVLWLIFPLLFWWNCSENEPDFQWNTRKIHWNFIKITAENLVKIALIFIEISMKFWWYLILHTALLPSGRSEPDLVYFFSQITWAEPCMG